MTYNQKLNAISRLIIFLTIIGFFITNSFKLLITGVITLGIIIFLYKTEVASKPKLLNDKIKEGFTNPLLYEQLKDNFSKPNEKNPFGNVLLPDINNDPNKAQAPPSFNPVVEEEINTKTKEMISKNFQDNNSDIKQKLFKDLGDEVVFDQFMHNFYSTPNTEIPNNQKAFAEFCYGNMPSCKDGDPLACEKKNLLHPNL